MAAIDVMRRYLQTVQRGDWPAAFGFFADDGDVEIRRANLYRLAGERITEVWIFEADQYEVDELLGG
jgi:hypothetical protein